jgi:glyoxylase-like metal-dependent hydrolase (beta-lactamase superfamily II)
VSDTLPVVTPWFTATPATPGGTITLIREPHADPLVRANLWHVRGRDRDLLVDCGLGVTSFHQALPGFVAREPVLVLTHGHFDHMGSAHEFTECWAHALEPVAEPVFGTLDGAALAGSVMYPAATHAVLPPWLIDARPSPSYDPRSYQVRPAQVTRYLADGDLVDLGDRAFTVLHLPGHSPGSIGLYDGSDGTLFSGDVVCEGGLIDDITGCSVPDYLATMRRLRDLPVRTVHGGHGDDFGPARLHELIDGYIAART